MSVYSAWAREPVGMRRALLGPDAETMRRWLAFLRIAVGGCYLYAFASKITGMFLANFGTELQHLADVNRLHLARLLIRGVLLQHWHLFGWMVLVAELLAGALLLLGLGTRVVALLALALQVIYLLVSLGSSTALTLTNCLFIVALLVIYGTDGGWRWSLDELIVNRR